MLYYEHTVELLKSFKLVGLHLGFKQTAEKLKHIL